MKKLVSAVCGLLFIAALCCSCSNKKAVTAAGFYFDTVVTLTAWGIDDAEARSALEACAEWEALLSKTREGSDVWRINNARGSSVSADASTVELIELSKRASGLSGGAFDITVDACVKLWDFKEGVIPGRERLAEAARRVDYTKIELSEGRVRLPEGMSIDLGGVAKGYIADELIKLLEQKGASAALVDAGGDIAVTGRKPDGSDWSIGIRDPDAGAGAVMAKISIADGAVVTSGTYERRFTKDGVSYHHILDPKTGMSANSGIISATVISKSAALADALSTACIVMGAEGAAEMIEGIEDTEAVFITGDRKIICTSGAEEMLKHV